MLKQSDWPKMNFITPRSNPYKTIKVKNSLDNSKRKRYTVAVTSSNKTIRRIKVMSSIKDEAKASKPSKVKQLFADDAFIIRRFAYGAGTTVITMLWIAERLQGKLFADEGAMVAALFVIAGALWIGNRK